MNDRLEQWGVDYSNLHIGSDNESGITMAGHNEPFRKRVSHFDHRLEWVGVKEKELTLYPHPKLKRKRLEVSILQDP
jgi:hypothetical protein